jgi:hypothetical protein
MNKRQINKEIERQKIEQFIKDNCWMLDYAWAPDHWYEVSEDAVVEFHKFISWQRNLAIVVRAMLMRL